jgi:hypothetical protein
MKKCGIRYFENNQEKIKVFQNLTYQGFAGLYCICFGNMELYRGTKAGAIAFLFDNIDNYK